MTLSLRHARLALAAVAVGGLLSAAQTSGSFAASDQAADASAQPVIVVLNDQLAATLATLQDVSNRRKQANDAQDAVLGRLAGAAPL